MPFSVIYDANVRYGNTLRDLHIRIARAGLKLSDMDDRHVLAAAMKAGAQVIVTADHGFTPQELEPWNIEAKSPDDFVLDQISIDAKIVTLVLVKLRTRAVAHLKLSRVCSSS